METKALNLIQSFIGTYKARIELNTLIDTTLSYDKNHFLDLICDLDILREKIEEEIKKNNIYDTSFLLLKNELESSLKSNQKLITISTPTEILKAVENEKQLIEQALL